MLQKVIHAIFFKIKINIFIFTLIKNIQLKAIKLKYIKYLKLLSVYYNQKFILTQVYFCRLIRYNSSTKSKKDKLWSKNFLLCYQQR